MWLNTVYIVAITAEAMSAALIGMRMRFDLFGVCTLGMVTALGGGTVRDVLLGHFPLNWVAHPEYLMYTLLAAVLTSMTAPLVARMQQVFLLADAVGLAAFAVIGCHVGQSMQVHPGIALASGVITGIAGGLLRDLLCNQVPLVLRSECYASIAFVVTLILMGFGRLGASFNVAALIAIVVGVGLRVLSLTMRRDLCAVLRRSK